MPFPRYVHNKGAYHRALAPGARKTADLEVTGGLALESPERYHQPRERNRTVDWNLPVGSRLVKTMKGEHHLHWCARMALASR